MPKVVNGTPKSILRYSLDINKRNLIAFNYRDRDKNYKIKSSYVNNNLNVVIETSKRNIPIGAEVYHDLFFYESILNNIGKYPKALKVYKNDKKEVLVVTLKWNDEIDVNVEIDPFYTGVDYGTSFVVFNSNYKPQKIKEYIFTDYGIIYNENVNDYYMSKVIILSELGNLNNEIVYADFVSPMSVFSHRIKSLELRPKTINTGLLNTNLEVEYNYQGLIKSVSDESITCFYNIFEDDKNQIINSTSTLLFDAFNPKNYYDGKTITDEFIVSYPNEYRMEFLQIIYDDVKSIDDNDTKMYKFNDYVEQYFKY